MYQLYGGGQFYWWRDQEKTTDMSQDTVFQSKTIASQIN